MEFPDGSLHLRYFNYLTQLSLDSIEDMKFAEDRLREYVLSPCRSSILVDLTCFIDVPVLKVDRDYSLHRTYIMFRTLALRHLVVVDGRNRVLGIIERTDLLPFNIRERLEKLLADPKDANIGADDSKTIVVDYSVEDGNDEDGAKISRGWSMSRYVAPSTEGATENTSVIHEAWTTPVEIHTVETTSSHSRIKLDADEGSIDDDDDDDDHHTDSGCSNTRM